MDFCGCLGVMLGYCGDYIFYINEVFDAVIAESGHLLIGVSE